MENECKAGLKATIVGAGAWRWWGCGPKPSQSCGKNKERGNAKKWEGKMGT